MMELLVRALRPLFLPLLKLDLRPPRLPEGSSLVRELKPTRAWLTYRYLGAVLGLTSQVVGVVVVSALAWLKLGQAGLLVATALLLVEVVLVGIALVTTRVDYELRHYLVGDRALRVSAGALTRREVTLSYANVQNLEVTQGPLERLFGFKSLTVSTAGASGPRPGGQPSTHEVNLVGLDNADELRELILGLLKHRADSGLGEPAATTALPATRLAEVRDAALELRDAARQRGG